MICTLPSLEKVTFEQVPRCGAQRLLLLLLLAEDASMLTAPRVVLKNPRDSTHQMVFTSRWKGVDGYVPLELELTGSTCLGVGSKVPAPVKFNAPPPCFAL